MKIKKTTKAAFTYIGFVCAAMIIVILVGRKNGIKIHEGMAQDNISATFMDDTGLWNQQGAIQTGGSQVYLAGSNTVIGSLYGNMYSFHEDTQELQFFCKKNGCLHIGNDCPARQSLSYLLRYSMAIYGVPKMSADNEIWRLQNTGTECWFRADDTILGLAGYKDYLYYLTEFGVYRVLAENPDQAEPVLDEPILYEYLTFDGDKMYFVSEDSFLYEAYLDGSGKKRMVDEKAVSPQICDGFLYYRSAAYEENGVFQMKNTLKRISLEDGRIEKILDSVYRFSVVPEEKKIYYTELPDFSKSKLSFFDVLWIDTGETRRLAECMAATEIGVFPESDWIILEMPEGDYDTYYCCMKKDGSGWKRLEYPDGVAE